MRKLFRSGRNSAGRLLQRTVNRSKLRVEVSSDAINHSNDRKGNTGCNQAVLDCGGSRPISHEQQKRALQDCLLIAKMPRSPGASQREFDQ
jgi:hypothetical protein